VPAPPAASSPRPDPELEGWLAQVLRRMTSRAATAGWIWGQRPPFYRTGGLARSWTLEFRRRTVSYAELRRWANSSSVAAVAPGLPAPNPIAWHSATAFIGSAAPCVATVGLERKSGC